MFCPLIIACPIFGMSAVGRFHCIKKPVTLAVPKNTTIFRVSFYGKVSGLVKSGLIWSLHKHLPFCKIQIVFKTSNHLKNYFSFKDIIPEHSCHSKFKILSAEAAMLHTLVKPLGT